MLDRPYFMNDKSWYYFDEKDWEYKLTENAPKKAIESYNDFYKTLNDNGTR